MALQILPRYIIYDILHRVVVDYNVSISKILSLRLVDRRFNTDLMHLFYDKDATRIHCRILAEERQAKPSGIGLLRFVKGFIFRPKGSSEVLHTIWRTLRDGVLIFTVILASVGDETDARKVLPGGDSNLPSVSSGENGKQRHTHTSSWAPETTDGEYLPENALAPISKAYIDLLGEGQAFDSLDDTWQRSATAFEKLNNKTGHFWAFVAAIHDGRPSVISLAIKACQDRFEDEEDRVRLQMHLAAGLLVAAKQGNLEAAELLLAHEAAKVTLRFQNVRFAGKNAMETAIEASQYTMIQLLLNHGWNLTILPTDYTRALRSTASCMKESNTRHELLRTLLEGDCQQWRSDSIVAGLLLELCKRGDLVSSELLLSLLNTPSKAHYHWEWMFVDNGDNDNIAAPAPVNTNNNNDDDLDEFFFNNDFNFVPIEEKAALFQAVQGKHDNMVSFLFQSKHILPEAMSNSFTANSRLFCLEYAIRKHQQETLQQLIAHMDDMCPTSVFLYATIHGNVAAMKTLLPLVNLHALILESDQYWEFDRPGSNLRTAIEPLMSYINPNDFLFQAYKPPACNITLGTHTLVCAIKSLHIDAARFLLDQKCRIGTRLLLFSPNLIDTSHACLYIPPKDPPLTNPLTISPHPSHRALFFTLHRFTYLGFKHMIESGTSPPTHRTWLLTRKARFRLWRCRGDALDDMDARIITGIHIPAAILDREETGEADRKFDAMSGLLRRWKMPHIYID